MSRFLFNVIFCVFVFFSSSAYALTSGTTASGSVTAGGTSYQSFSGTAGQGVILNGYSPDFTVRIDIYKPGGAYWTGGNLRVLGTLPDTGTYSVEITATSPSASGDYDLDYVRGSAGVSSGSLTSGQSYNGTLAINGLESYEFDGTAGQGVMLTGDSSYTNVIRVYKPDGSYYTYGNRRLIISSLPSTGTYTVAVYNSSPTASGGAYRLDYVRGSAGVSDGTILSGESYNSSLDDNAIASFEFEGTAGKGAMLFADASYIPVIRLYKPDGSYYTYGNRRVIISSLPSTGTYTVAVYNSSPTASGGAYRLDYVQGGETVSSGTLISGSGRSGSLQKNALDTYIFTGTSGNSLSVSSTGSYTRHIRLYKPDGSYYTYGSNSLSTTLNATGTFTLAFYASSATNSGGDYTVTLTTTPISVAATDAEKSGLCACTGQCVSPSMMVGNPVNFDVGYKKQTEVDYDAGGLYFSRIYRSDSTWTNNTFGSRWRHNYARTLDVGASTADITDGTGATTSYTSSGGLWVADDSDITATLVYSSASDEYVYTLPNDAVERYSSAELLTRIEYLGGGALDLSYNSASQLTKIENENGRELSLTYTSGGNVGTLVTPDGTFSYSYDGNGNLDTVTKPDTNTREYHYENATYTHALTGITNEQGIRYASFSYDANGKAILTEHAGNVDDYDITYNGDGTSTTSNPLGKDSTYYYTNIEGLRRIVQEDAAATTYTSAGSRYFNYDDKGRLIGKTDWENNTTRYQYDDRGNITQIKKAANTDIEQATSITYETSYNLPDVVSAPGRTTDYDYDAYGRVTSVTVTDTGTSEARTTTYSYYSNTTDGNGNTVLGRLKQVNGPRTDVTDSTDFAYDSSLDLTTITNALSQVTEITARDAAGRVTAFDDINDVETALSYSSSGWLVSSTRAAGTALAAETTFDYNSAGNLVKVTLPNDATAEYSYDSAQRLTGIEDALGNTISYTLNAAGNITSEDIKDSTATLKYTHDQAFDEMSRIIQSVGASSQTAHYAYDKNSNLTTYTDPRANATTYAYDGLQRLVTQTDAHSGVTAQGYDDLDYLTSVEDPRANTTTYNYNAFGDIVSEGSPDRGTLSYILDKAGNITQVTDARGEVALFSWDALNRVTEIGYVGAAALGAELTYDSASGCGTGGGRLCYVSASIGATAFAYDDLGRVTDVTDTRGGNDLTTSYDYDLAGNITGITLPSGRDITYGLNDNGQVSYVSASVAGGDIMLASAVSYAPFGPVTGLTYGNSLTLSAAFDQDYNPTSRSVSGGIFSHTYDTDDNGNITQIGGWDYAYDELNRLDQQYDGSTTTDITYDSASNRTSWDDGTTVNYTIPAGSNKTSAVGGDSYTYDDAGNITDDGTNSYTWNEAGDLATVNTTDGVYSYDWMHRRVKKVAASTTTYYVYGPGGLLFGEYDSNGDMIREYIYLNGEPLAQIDAGSPETLTYLHTDHLGAPRYGTNTGGTQVWSWDYDAFGDGSTSGSVTVNLRLPGQYYDAESGLYYNWNRYYNPVIGRYISSDPIGLAGGMNTYNYANVSPLMYTDPEGLMTDLDINCINGGGEILPCIRLMGGGGGAARSVKSKAKDSTSLTPLGSTQKPSTAPNAKPPSCPTCKSGKPTGSGPKPAQNFIEPTNPPSYPPKADDLPVGHTIRTGPKTEQYPTGYWRQYNTYNQPVDPSTGKPPGNLTGPEFESRTHVRLPE